MNGNHQSNKLDRGQIIQHAHALQEVVIPNNLTRLKTALGVSVKHCIIIFELTPLQSFLNLK